MSVDLIPVSETFVPNVLDFFKQYEKFVSESAVFPGDVGVWYCTTKLCGEAGEVSEKVVGTILEKFDGGFTDYRFARSQFDTDDIILELGDITWYCAAIARELGSDLETLLRTPMSLPVISNTGIDIVLWTAVLSSLTGHVGERVGKFIRDRKTGHTNAAFLSDPEWCKQTLETVTGVLMVVDTLSDKFGSSLPVVMKRNMAKLAARRVRGTISGSGDHR